MFLMNFKSYLLCEMARTYTDIDTGIGNKIYIKMETVGGKHGARIKVSNIRGSFSRNDYFVVTIAQIPEVVEPEKHRVNVNPKELARIKYWISQNYSILLKMSQYLETTYNQPLDTPNGRIMLDFNGLEKHLITIK